MTTPVSPPSVESKERDFHDRWAEEIDALSLDIERVVAGSTSPENRWIFSRLGPLVGKRILELGSGSGEPAVFFARQGAVVIAADISSGMLDVVSRLAKRHGVRVDTAVASADDLAAFADQSFDIVYAANLLHHVDIGKCLSEVRRVLKPGGKAAFWDPLAYNPAINVYRRMAGAVRTENEHPLKRTDVALMRSMFREVETRFFWLASLVVFLKFYLIDRIHPSEDRYWKLIIRWERELSPLVRRLLAVDDFFLKVCPPLKWWCWNVAAIATK